MFVVCLFCCRHDEQQGSEDFPCRHKACLLVIRRKGMKKKANITMAVEKCVISLPGNLHLVRKLRMTTDNKFQNIDGGVVPHRTLDRKAHPEAFYDIEALGKMMDEYYHK